VGRDKAGNMVAKGMVEEVVCGVEAMEEVMANGHKARSVGHTDMNAHSSRSHMIVSVRVVGTKRGDGGESKDGGEGGAEEVESRMYLIDLAGSERLSKSQATGKRLAETQAINKSLSALGDVMGSLQNRDKHVPYRNSKLTHLLQDALGGKAKALMVAQVSPVAPSANETLCTIQFASRAASVKLGAVKRNVQTEAFIGLQRGASKQQERINRSGAEVAKLRQQIEDLTEAHQQELQEVAERVGRQMEATTSDLERQVAAERSAARELEHEMASKMASTQEASAAALAEAQADAEKGAAKAATKAATKAAAIAAAEAEETLAARLQEERTRARAEGLKEGRRASNAMALQASAKARQEAEKVMKERLSKERKEAREAGLKEGRRLSSQSLALARCEGLEEGRRMSLNHSSSSLLEAMPEDEEVAVDMVLLEEEEEEEEEKKEVDEETVEQVTEQTVEEVVAEEAEQSSEAGEAGATDATDATEELVLAPKKLTLDTVAAAIAANDDIENCPSPVSAKTPRSRAATLRRDAAQTTPKSKSNLPRARNNNNISTPNGSGGRRSGGKKRRSRGRGGRGSPAAAGRGEQTATPGRPGRVRAVKDRSLAAKVIRGGGGPGVPRGLGKKKDEFTTTENKMTSMKETLASLQRDMKTKVSNLEAMQAGKSGAAGAATASSTPASTASTPASRARQRRATATPRAAAGRTAVGKAGSKAGARRTPLVDSNGGRGNVSGSGSGSGSGSAGAGKAGVARAAARVPQNPRAGRVGLAASATRKARVPSGSSNASESASSRRERLKVRRPGDEPAVTAVAAVCECAASLHCGVFTLRCLYTAVSLHCGVFTLRCLYFDALIYL